MGVSISRDLASADVGGSEKYLFSKGLLALLADFFPLRYVRWLYTDCEIQACDKWPGLWNFPASLAVPNSMVAGRWTNLLRLFPCTLPLNCILLFLP